MTYLEWLKKEGYALETTVPVDGTELSWVRPSRYGAPKCSTNKAPVNIVITKNGETFSMEVRASTDNYWANLIVYDISPEWLIKRGRGIEHRLTAAWMELAS